MSNTGVSKSTTKAHKSEKAKEKRLEEIEPRKRTKEKKEMHYQVGIVDYNTDRENATYHKALFVATKSNVRNKQGKISASGNLYEVLGPAGNRQETTVIHDSRFEFKMTTSIIPENSYECVAVHRGIGRVEKTRLDELYDVCKSVHPPRGPFLDDGPPDCTDWLNNVLHRLWKKHIVEFEEGFRVPSEEVSMVWMTGTPSAGAGPSSSQR